MNWRYKTFSYQPVSGFPQRKDRNGKTLENRLNGYAQAGWEFVETIDCRKGLLQPREYIILLRRDNEGKSTESSVLNLNVQPDVTNL